MNGFTEHRASDASERPDSSDLVLTWDSSTAMLPLVGRITSDIVQHHQRLMHLHPEKNRLDRLRRELAWPERSRRYQIQEEIMTAQAGLREAELELASLGLVLLHGPSGLVGFPTIVNDRRAFFSWKPGEDGLHYWNFSDDTVRRKVPEHWTRQAQERSRKGKFKK